MSSSAWVDGKTKSGWPTAGTCTCDDRGCGTKSCEVCACTHVPSHRLTGIMLSWLVDFWNVFHGFYSYCTSHSCGHTFFQLKWSISLLNFQSWFYLWRTGTAPGHKADVEIQAQSIAGVHGEKKDWPARQSERWLAWSSHWCQQGKLCWKSWMFVYLIWSVMIWYDLNIDLCFQCLGEREIVWKAPR